MTEPNKGGIRPRLGCETADNLLYVYYPDHITALAEERQRTIDAIEKLRADFQAQAHYAIDRELWRFDEAIRNLGKVEGE